LSVATASIKGVISLTKTAAQQLAKNWVGPGVADDGGRIKYVIKSGDTINREKPCSSEDLLRSLWGDP
jgi:hypothetical protein